MYLFKNNTHQHKINTWGDYHIRKEWGIYINIEQVGVVYPTTHVGVYSSNPIVSPPVGVITNSVIQR
jgi:hypothetical protein